MAVLRYYLLLLLFITSKTTAYSFLNKRALVTGSSGGIGKGIALALAKQGVHVYLHYHTRREGALATREAIAEKGGTCLGIVKCDFRKDANIQRLFSEALLEPPIDILVNNAGMVTKAALEDDDDELSMWKETLQVNLYAPLLLSKLAKPMMMKNGGVIINISSIHGDRSNEYMGAYAASKAGLDSLTRTLALEWASCGIRVNGIAPGVVPVERSAAAFADPKVTQGWTKHVPVERLGTVEEIAQATVSLIENEWVTGTTWTVDGGMMARSNMPQRPRPETAMVEQQEIDDEVKLEE